MISSSIPDASLPSPADTPPVIPTGPTGSGNAMPVHKPPVRSFSDRLRLDISLGSSGIHPYVSDEVLPDPLIHDPRRLAQRVILEVMRERMHRPRESWSYDQSSISAPPDGSPFDLLLLSPDRSSDIGANPRAWAWDHSGTRAQDRDLEKAALEYITDHGHRRMVVHVVDGFGSSEQMLVSRSGVTYRKTPGFPWETNVEQADQNARIQDRIDRVQGQSSSSVLDSVSGAHRAFPMHLPLDTPF